MFKKTIASILLAVMLFSAISFQAFALEFPDLPSSHWANSYVMTLVNEGTVNGNENGMFEPNKMVTRAEFVKMIGKGPQTRTEPFADVPESHWGYEYIMTSGLDGDANNNFYPSLPMSRGDTVELLWKRAGMPTGIIVPSVITNQADAASINKDAIAWIYAYGVMIGSDGLDLRLSDPISRAEVSALIIKARSINPQSAQINFADTVSPEILEKIFNSVAYFKDIQYSPDATITNGDLATAALKFASNEVTLTYSAIRRLSPSFSGKNAANTAIMTRYCLGDDKNNADFDAAPATNADAVAMLMFALSSNPLTHLSASGETPTYTDIDESNAPSAPNYTAAGYQNGIQLYAGGTIKPDKAATLKEIAAILLQINDLYGLQVVTTNEQNAGGDFIQYLAKLESDAGKYPQNAVFFTNVLKDVPSELYTVPFTEMSALDGSVGTSPKKMYSIANDYSVLFASALKSYADAVETKTGVKLKFTHLPSLVANNGFAFVTRVKCEVSNADGKNVMYKDAFPGVLTAENETILYDGMTFYTDFLVDTSLVVAPGNIAAFSNPVYKVQ